MTQDWDRLVAAEGINNFRDYGGWRVGEGGRVRTGRLFRSAHHAGATPGDAELMQRLGIAVVTDLRHPSEQREEPSAWLQTFSLPVIEEADPNEMVDARAPHVIALERSDFSYDALRQFMVDSYARMPYDARLVALYRRYFNALAETDGAMLIHCAAGKDRTGILAALTHALLGVHPDDAMEDYLLTNSASNIEERLPRIIKLMTTQYGRPIGEDALLAMLRVDEAYLRRAHAAIEDGSGSMRGYLADVLGIDDDMAARIREKLVQ